MRMRFVLFPLTSLLISSAALADYGTPPPPPTQPSSSSSGTRSADGTELTSSRKDAERYFADAYDDVVKAGKEADKGKKENAQKKYKRALERCQNAVQLDTTYHEAWNLIGFTSRKLGDYPTSFAAYKVALRLKPDFALAHEYYGEGLLETGDLAGAKEQLVALRASGTPELIAELEGAISKYEARHPETSAASTKAAADTSTTVPPASSN
jgi:tetratricopeptide (TPR) repeat protein